jgi:hypothetical protein
MILTVFAESNMLASFALLRVVVSSAFVNTAEDALDDALLRTPATTESSKYMMKVDG